MRVIDKQELEQILKDHKLWLESRWTDNVEGSSANLSGANLSRADLSGANLSGANLSCANLSCANLSGANLSCANLSGANLSGANLKTLHLKRADMRGKDLDFCGIPLSCGGLQWQIDRRLAIQLIYHLCSHDCDDAEINAAQNALLPLANQFHRVKECGAIEPKK